MITFGRDRKTLIIVTSIFDKSMIFEFECKTQAPTEIDAELRLQALTKEFNQSIQRRASDRALRLFKKWQKNGLPKDKKGD